jgi:putative hydrolase of the HAD superfamily
VRPAVRAVLLDVDDTLVDTRAAFRAAITGVVSTWMPHLNDAGRERAVLRWAHDPTGSFRRFTRGEISMAQQRRIRVSDLHGAFGGPPVDDATFAAWDAAYETTFRGAWRATQDGVRLVARLERLGVPFGVVTNLHAAYQEGKLTAVGLGHLRVLGSLDTVGVGKPDPRIFLAGCAGLGVAPGEVAYVGDEPDIDAAAAAEAGLVGVWLDRFSGVDGESRQVTDGLPLRITSLDRLGDVLQLRSDLGTGVGGR